MSTAPTARPAARPRLSAGERREAILAAARTVFGARGYHEATTREIAAQAGVSEALLYQHFPGKRQLFEAVVTAAGCDLERRIAEAARENDPLPAVLDAYFSFVEEESDLYRVFFGQALQADPAFQRLYARLSSRLLELVEAALDPGLAVPRDLAARGLAGMVSELALWWVEDRTRGKEEMVGHAARMARGLLLSEVADGSHR
jgi:AcrR family transcriptional regulator